MTRETVYAVIDSERDYQDRRWGTIAEHSHSLTEYLVYIDYYVKRAMASVSTESTEQSAADAMRKIAALAVVAMEEHGAPYRNI